MSTAEQYVAEIAQTRKPEGAWAVLRAAFEDVDLDHAGLERVLAAATGRIAELPAFFFRRRVKVANPGEQPGFMALTIYGFEATSPYPEDLPRILADRERGQLYSRCYSALCPEGELGLTPLDTTEAITQREFDRARVRGWTE
ncbi:MAG TPA: hypothetical protein VGR51_09005 [Thermoplasmata archaeon]|nr:hypothetical protein [Thermoplasmata archaeon]